MSRAKLLYATFAVSMTALGGAVSGLLDAWAAAPAAQEAPAQVIDVAPGVIIQTLAAGMPDDVPGRRLALSRLTLQPDAIGPAHLHPGMTVIYVETGSFGWTLVRGAGTVTRASGEVEEVTEPGTEVVLEPGDTLVWDAYTAHTARGASDFPTAVIEARVLEVDKPVVIPTNDLGTPTA